MSKNATKNGREKKQTKKKRIQQNAQKSGYHSQGRTTAQFRFLLRLIPRHLYAARNRLRNSALYDWCICGVRPTSPKSTSISRPPTRHDRLTNNICAQTVDLRDAHFFSFVSNRRVWRLICSSVNLSKTSQHMFNTNVTRRTSFHQRLTANSLIVLDGNPIFFDTKRDVKI